MSQILYFLVLKPVSLLPFWLLYRISDFLYLVLYKLIGYRTKVVRRNIKLSFPEKDKFERQKIEKAFYGHFFDLVVEGVKLFSLNPQSLLRKYRIGNPEVFDPYILSNQRVIITSGHYGNWELASQTLTLTVGLQAIGIYSPLNNKFLDHKLRTSREKFGMELLSRHDVATRLAQPVERPEGVMFATDQAPSNVHKAYWTMFLNQETPVFFGAELYATRYNSPVLYTRYHRLGRGRYEVTFHPISDHPDKLPYGVLTELHTRLLEKDINEHPEIWLWTHRRWKRNRPEEVTLHPPQSLPEFPVQS